MPASPPSLPASTEGAHSRLWRNAEPVPPSLPTEPQRRSAKRGRGREEGHPLRGKEQPLEGTENGPGSGWAQHGLGLRPATQVLGLPGKAREVQPEGMAGRGLLLLPPNKQRSASPWEPPSPVAANQTKNGTSPLVSRGIRETTQPGTQNQEGEAQSSCSFAPLALAPSPAPRAHTGAGQPYPPPPGSPSL